MDPAIPRRCRHCRADIPAQGLACPNCGRYFDGDFDFPGLIDGVRSVDPTLDPGLPAAVEATSLDAVPTMLPQFLDPAYSDPQAARRWVDIPPSRPTPRSLSIGQGHEVHLPEVGAVTDLPYATDDEPDGSGDVIDLRDKPDPPRPARSWLGRRKTRA